jgi:hypothetical protein
MHPSRLEKIDSWRRWIVAGLLLGLTVWVRNAGIALIAAEMSIVAICIVQYAITERQAAQRLAKGAGPFVVAVLIPMLLLFCFNLYYFGTAFPYHAPPSKVGLLKNITNCVAAQFHDITGLRLGILHGSTRLGRTLLGPGWQKFVTDRLEGTFVPVRQERLLLIAQAKRNVSE